MIFNGHTHESIAALDDVTMLQIQTMYADGLVGNRQILEVLGTLTAGVFNYMRSENAPPYKLANIINLAYDYLYPPLSPEDQQKAVTNGLVAFMTQAPGYKSDILKVKQDG